MTPSGTRPRARLPWRLLMFFWKYAIGVLLCLTPLTSVLAAGWCQRLMQRAALKRWHRLSGFAADGTGFADFAMGDSRTVEHVAWPNWLLGMPDVAWRIDAGPGRVTVLVRRIAGSLWDNLVQGFQVTLNTALLVLPAGALLLLSWWGGWQNSFHKGYEQAWVGPLVGVLGIALFIVVMTYVPLAQARQAAAGHWRAFWNVPLIRRLARRRRRSGLALALAYVLLALPVMGIKAAPLVLGADTDTMPPEAIRALADQFYLLATAALFLLLVLTRLAAARIYARALFDAVQSGDVELDELSAYERQVFGRLRVAPSAPRHAGHAVGRLAVKLPRAVLLALTLAAWFAVAAQLYAAQFLNYAWFAWLNHPLILLPWIRYLPGQG